MSSKRTLTIHEINDVLEVMERQWGEPYKRYSLWTTIIWGGIIGWGIPLTALWVVFRGH